MQAVWFFLLAVLATGSFAASLTDETLDVDGQPRRFLVHDYSKGTPTALVILLHGGGGSGQNMAEQTGFDKVAEREGLIAVYPYGSAARFDNILLTWNAGHCCAYALRENVDDIRFLSLLIDRLVATRNIDPSRVYVTGLSNGGMMTHRVGIELADKVAAIAPVISSVFGDEPLREYAMPTLIINGAVDARVKVEGGELTGFPLGIEPADLPTKPIAAQGEFWSKVNGCTSFTDSSTTDFSMRTYADCRAGGAVQSVVVNGNGHAWPGGTAPRGDADQPVTTVDANEVIWAFFKQFRRSNGDAGPTSAYYYDGQLHVPAFTANGAHYSARLDLTSAQPLEFSLTRLTPIPAGSATGGSYDNGVLRLDAVAVGAASYRASLLLSSVAPLRLRLLELR